MDGGAAYIKGDVNFSALDMGMRMGAEAHADWHSLEYCNTEYLTHFQSNSCPPELPQTERKRE
jgi:hypothetical protein